jgi:hypothetical protein
VGLALAGVGAEDSSGEVRYKKTSTRPGRPGATHFRVEGISVKMGMEDENSDALIERPVENEELRGVTVLVANLLQAQELVGELREEREGLCVLFGVIMRAQFEMLKNLGEIAGELTEEETRREHLASVQRRAAREYQRLRIPLWFWRPEREGRDIEDVHAMLRTRARFLAQEQRAGLDDSWDLLVEFCGDWLRLEPDEKILRQVLNDAYTQGGDHASPS